MKNLKFLLLFVISSFALMAANECSQTDHSTTMSSSHTYYDNTDTIYWDQSGWNRKKYYIQVAEAGHIDITIRNNTNNGDVRFNVDINRCPDYNGAGTSWSHDFNGPEDFNIDVTAWAQIGNQNYTLIIQFTPAANRPPVADDVSVHTVVNTPVTVHLSATDPDGDPIQSYPIVSGPSHGTLSGAEPDITYTPDTNYTGNDTFTYRAIDSHGDGSNTATVTISVTINHLPAAQDDNASTYLGTAVTIDVLSNDSDPDGDLLSVTGTSNGPAHGSVTVNTDNTVTYTPNSGYLGTDSFDYTVSDGHGGTDTATVTVDIRRKPPANLCTQTGVHEGYRDFCLRYQETTYGNMVTIGNTILVAPGTERSNKRADCSTYRNGTYIDNARDANNYYKLCAFYDDDNVNFPTTRAELPLPNHPDLKIKWAGLYWQALVPNGTSLSNMVIKLKHKTTDRHSPRDRYYDVRPKVLNWGKNVGHRGYTSYSAFADVTRLFERYGWKGGHITVGDIPVYEGQVDSLGTYGAWTLVVVYESEFEKFRNFSIYDGWKQVNDRYPSINIDISGFYAPKRTPIAAEVSVFAAEGDKHIVGDGLKAKPSKKTSWTTLRPPGVRDQTFNSSIHVVRRFSRSPDPTNNQGIDIQAYNLGTTGKNIMEPEESAIKFKFFSRQIGWDQDYFWPSMIAFNSELLVPKICYDYDLRIGDYRKVTPTDTERREFTVQQPASSEPLRTKVLIRSLESDFNISDTKYYLTFSPDDSNLTYNPNSSYVSWEGLNTYVHVDDLNSSNGMIPIGHDADIMPNGGLLDINESNYIKQDFNITDHFTGSFDIHVKGSIVFVPEDGPIEYEFSTDAPVGSSFRIDRCPTNPVYDPIWGPFNVENASATFRQSEYRRFPLYTQIAGRPFTVTVASYDPNQPSAAADANTTVEVEIIDVSAFDNNQSVGYDITCEEPTSRGMGAFVHFDQQHPRRVRLRIPREYQGFERDLTLRNAAFRVWVLTQENNATHRRDIVDHQCRSATDHACFDQLYANVYKNKERLVTDKCDAKCTNSSGNTCYQCLRTYAGKPYCSRDNFAVRPAFFKISVFDDNNASAINTGSVGSTAIGDNSNPNDLPLIARYPYPMTLEARNYSDNGRAKEYYGTFSDSYPDRNATLNFTLSSADCADDSNSTIPVNFFDGDAYQSNGAAGALSPYINLTGPNAGDYALHLTDSSWTLVDQETYQYQTMFKNNRGNKKHHPDCDLNNTTYSGPNKAGCYISSDVAGSGSGRSDYYDLNLSFHPDHFLFDSLVLKVEPRNDTTTSWLYMSDLNRSTAMAVTLEGNVSARGADNTTLSNFIDQCAANPVDLNMNLIQTPADLRSDANNSVPFQHRFETLNVSGNPFLPTDANATETLGSALFGQNGDSNGSASFKFYYNFKKPLQEYVNVADVNFTSMDANGTTADQAWGYSSSTHLPNGAKDINITRHFYFAQIVAKDSDGVMDSLTPRDESGSTHPLNLYVEIYCEDNASGWPGCTTLDGVGTLDAGTNLYRASKVNTWIPSKDGQVISIDRTDSNDTAGTHATITPNNAITFNNDASSPQITVAYTAASNFRPETAIGVVNPDPWLLFDQNYSDGKPRFRIRFINELFYWKGEGEVGHVIDIPSAGKNNRLGW